MKSFKEVPDFWQKYQNVKPDPEFPEGFLMGNTVKGEPIEGKDSVRIKCPEPKKPEPKKEGKK